MGQTIWFSDGHIDSILLLKEKKTDLISATGQWSLSQCFSANMKFQVMALFIEPQYKPDRAMQEGLKLIEIAHRFIEKNNDKVFLIQSKKDLQNIPDKDRIGILLSIEGGEILRGQVWMVDLIYRLGVRALGLTWNERNELADGVGESESGGGLTQIGKKVVKRMNEIGMAVDLSHLSERSFWDVIHYSHKPPYASHSCVYNLCPHPRNLKDDQIKAIAQAGGVIGINFCPVFLNINSEATRDDLVKHIQYIADLVGPEYIALGSDYDGIDEPPAGLESVDKLPSLIYDLERCGFSQKEIEQILGANLVRYYMKILS